MGACQPSAVTASAGLRPQARSGLDQRRSPHGAEPFKVLSLFAGIGGFDLGLERTGGFKTVAFCEIEPFAVRVLNKHWPEVPVYGDVRQLTAERLATDGIAPNVICGGFPCQDISSAGLGAGIDGERSGLWSEIARLVREIRPCYVIVENVAMLLSRGLGRVLGDLAALGYDAEWHCIPASAVGAPHRRDRIWIVAHPASERPGETRADSEHEAQRLGGSSALLADAKGSETGRSQSRDSDGALKGGRPLILPSLGGRDRLVGVEDWDSEPDVCRVADGVSANVDRVARLGNAVVPQIPELIGRAILQAEGGA